VNPPKILLDLSFLVAVRDHDDPHHHEAVAMFRPMIDDYVAERAWLVARNDHLDTAGDGELFAVVEKLHVARQHRNAAADIVARNGTGMDEAITLVMVHRCGIRQVATFDERLDSFEFERVAPPPAAAVEAPAVELS
jgi:predicted nucleic acid-binding protein